MPTKFPELWAELGRPIPESAVKIRIQNGKQLHYITARTTMNRLDLVLGPENWWAEFFPHGPNAVLCKLSIRLPDGQVISKCDVGSCAGIADSGDEEKSAASDALKRAGVMFGIARELYGDGNVLPELVTLTKTITSRVDGHSNAETELPATQSQGDNVQFLRESGMLRTGSEVFGQQPSESSGTTQQFHEYIASSCERWEMKLKRECERRKIPVPDSNPFTPERAAVAYCDESIRNGSLISIEVVDSSNRFDEVACLDHCAAAFAEQPDLVSRRIENYFEKQYHAVIGNTERDAYQLKHGHPPNKGPRANENAPSSPFEGNNDSWGPPRTGRAMFAAVMRLQEQTGSKELVKWVTNYCKANDMPKKMADLSPEQVKQVWSALNHKIAEEIPA